MSTQPTPYPLRMSDELRAHLEERARVNRRSLQAEIVALLEQGISGSAGQPDLEKFADQVAAKVVERLNKKAK